MIWRPRLWIAVAVIFTAVNIAGAVMAAIRGEAIHAGAHILLSLIGAYFVWRLALRRSVIGVGPDAEYRPGAAPVETPPELGDRLTHLEQAVDAVAIEVERIGEGQRFITRSLVDRDPAPPRGESPAEPTDAAPKDADGHERSY